MEKKKGKEKPSPTRTPLRKITDPKDIAREFAIKVHEKFDRTVKASILFGSQAKDSAKVGSDIDIILIIDDASINWDLELISWYREELAKIIENYNEKADLHINTVKLTTWWQDLMYGDPVVINILRYGEALIDIGGFFNPLKALLLKGKIHSTPEAIYAALQRAPGHLSRSKYAEMSAIEGIYWCMTDSAQAALMTAGKVPPSPEQIPLMLKEIFVDKGMLNMDAVKAMRDLYTIHKGILHHEIAEVKGADIDRWQVVAEKFLKDMTSIIDKLIEQQK
ncbi:MAG: nucleotidyltransferase domain-containing protein [Nanoarchaeota archaeon]